MSTASKWISLNQYNTYLTHRKLIICSFRCWVPSWEGFRRDPWHIFLQRHSHAERKLTPWWGMRITKYNRGKNGPLLPLHAEYNGSVCSLERCGFWPRVGHDRRTGSVWWWSESQANIQFQKHLWNEFIFADRNGPEAVVNRKNIEPAWCLLLGIFWSFCFLLLLLSSRFIFINSNSPDTQ